MHHAQPWCARYAHVILCIFVRATRYRHQVELGNFRLMFDITNNLSLLTHLGGSCTWIGGMSVAAWAFLTLEFSFPTAFLLCYTHVLRDLPAA